MKFAAASLALAASVALLGESAAATSAGQCLSAVSAYANSGQVETDGIEWNAQAAYYHVEPEAVEEDDADNADAEEQEDDKDDEEGDRRHRRLEDKDEGEDGDEEQAAEQAETTIFDQMQGLAEALGIEAEEAQDQNEGEDQDQDQQQQYQYQDLTYVMAYDEELAEALGIEDRDTFAQFYDLTYRLANLGGCGAGRRRLQDDEEEEEDAEDNGNENGNEEEGDAEEDAAEEMEGDLIENILMNCQDSYEAIGINLEEIEEDDESIKDLSLHIQIEQAIANGKLVITDGDYDQGFADLLELLNIDEDELDDDDVTNIKLKLAVKSGALTTYLMDNAAYGQAVDDWEELLQGFFQSIGMEDDIELDNLDSYLAADIYNREYDVEEYGCKAAMISQFGQKEAANRGYVEHQSAIKSFLDACSDKLTAGAIAGIAIAVAAVVALIAYGTYRIGRSKGSADKKAPLISISDKHSDTSAEEGV